MATAPAALVGVCPKCGKTNQIAGVTDADARADGSPLSTRRIDVSCDHCGADHRLHEFVEARAKAEQKRLNEQKAAALRASVEKAEAQRRERMRLLADRKPAVQPDAELAFVADPTVDHDAHAPRTAPSPAPHTDQDADIAALLREHSALLKTMRAHLWWCKWAAFVYLIPVMLLLLVLILGGSAGAAKLFRSILPW